MEVNAPKKAGTVEVNAPSKPATVTVNPPPKPGSVEVNPPRGSAREVAPKGSGTVRVATDAERARAAKAKQVGAAQGSMKADSPAGDKRPQRDGHKGGGEGARRGGASVVTGCPSIMSKEQCERAAAQEARERSRREPGSADSKR